MFSTVLEKHAPSKKKKIRANHAPYMTKALRKEIMKRSELETKFYKTKSVNDHKLYKKQKNFVSKLYKKERKTFYKSLDLKIVAQRKDFWRNDPTYQKRDPRLKISPSLIPKITLFQKTRKLLTP